MHQTILQICAAPICAAHHTSQVRLMLVACMNHMHLTTTAPQTNKPEEASSADHSARTALRRGRTFRLGHRLEQAGRGGTVDILGALAPAPRREPAMRCPGIAPCKGRASHAGL